MADRDVDVIIKGDSGRDKDGLSSNATERSARGEFVRSKGSTTSSGISTLVSSDDACESSPFSSPFGPSSCLCVDGSGIAFSPVFEMAKGETAGCGAGGEPATCAEHPGDLGLSTGEILTSNSKLNILLELANEICERAGDGSNEPGGPKESPLSAPVCGAGALVCISDRSRNASELWTLALFLPFLSFMS